MTTLMDTMSTRIATIPIPILTLAKPTYPTMVLTKTVVVMMQPTSMQTKMDMTPTTTAMRAMPVLTLVPPRFPTMVSIKIVMVQI